jgi:D-arabinose 5-phosphate isomerase GutQ
MEQQELIIPISSDIAQQTIVAAVMNSDMAQLVTITTALCSDMAQQVAVTINFLRQQTAMSDIIQVTMKTAMNSDVPLVCHMIS